MFVWIANFEKWILCEKLAHFSLAGEGLTKALAVTSLSQSAPFVICTLYSIIAGASCMTK